jgi:two-component system sensor histidine kinase CiaH
VIAMPTEERSLRTGREPFYRASKRLAVIFVVMAVAVFILTSLSLYLILRGDLQRGEGESESESDRVAVQRVNQSLRIALPLIDLAGVLVLTGLGYWYARRTLKPLRQTYEAQKRFVANASHELRTPLAIMKGDFQLALRRPEASKEALESGIEEVDRISGIVDDLVTLSRMDAQQEVLRLSRVDLSVLVEESVRKMTSFAQLLEVTMTSRVEPGIFTSGDRSALQRALYNVVKNAIEHSGEGAAVSVGLRRQAATAVITVVDTGRGMAPADVRRVFELFHRSDDVRGDGRAGGLGMPIAKLIVEAHHGSITLTSEPGRGTEVSITLPTTA